MLKVLQIEINRCLLNTPDFFNAVIKLKVDDKYMIVCFGVYLEYFIS